MKPPPDYLAIEHILPHFASDSKVDLDSVKKEYIAQLYASSSATPLIYDALKKGPKIRKILLIHSGVEQYERFYQNSNTDVFPIIYDTDSSSEELAALLKDWTTLDRLAIVFHDANVSSSKTKPFLNRGTPLFTKEDVSEKEWTPSSKNYSQNVKFMIELIRTHSIKHVDFLCCNTLKYDNWRAYYDLLTSATNTIVGASSNETGNLQFGGDWIMESTHEDIRKTYFNSNITSYSKTLVASTLSSSTTLYNSDFNDPASLYTFPITITGGSFNNQIIITFGDSINITSPNHYFIIDSPYVIIDSQGFPLYADYKVIDANQSDPPVSVNVYDGLFQNGTGYSFLDVVNNISENYFNGDSHDNVVIDNMQIYNTLYPGDPSMNYVHLTHPFYGVNTQSNIINACYSNGPLFSFNVYCTVTNCHVDKPPIFTGFAHISNVPTQHVEAYDCYTTGEITDYDGGIYGRIGAFTDASNTLLLSAVRCYSTGAISGRLTGGIFGISYASNNVSYVAESCYSSGVISGYYAGGIYGPQMISSNNYKAKSCYSTGNITGEYASGIVAKKRTSGYVGGFVVGTDPNEKGVYTTIEIDQCYSTGEITGINAGGIM